MVSSFFLKLNKLFAHVSNAQQTCSFKNILTFFMVCVGVVNKLNTYFILLLVFITLLHGISKCTKKKLIIV